MIMQRNKKSKLTVKECLPWPFEHIKLEISGLPDAWYNLYALSMKPQELGKFIYVYFVSPAVRYLVRRPPRGKNAIRIESEYKLQTRGEFIDRIKNLTAYNYAILNHWMKKLRKDWPETVKRAVQEFEDEQKSISGVKVTPRADEMAAYIMERDFGNEREKYSLNPWTGDLDSFRRTYLSNNKFKNYYKTYINLLIKCNRLPDLPLSTKDPLKAISSLL